MYTFFTPANKHSIMSIQELHGYQNLILNEQKCYRTERRKLESNIPEKQADYGGQTFSSNKNRKMFLNRRGTNK